MKSFRFFLLVCGLLAIVSCRKDEAPVETQPHSPLGPDIVNHREIWLHQGWECYASCDSLTMDTISRSDTVRFSGDTLSWSNAPWAHYVGYYDARDTMHVHFGMSGTPFGIIDAYVTPWQMRECHISGVPFRNTSAHTTTYLWFRRVW